MEISKTNLIEPNYEGISKMLDSFRDLYLAGAPREIVDKALEYHCKPMHIVNPLKLKGQVMPWEEITNDDINHLVFIYNRLVNQHKEDKYFDFMLRLDDIIDKLRRNGK